LPTPIYHITNINNLPRIVQTGGLWCDAERVRQSFACVGIAPRGLALLHELSRIVYLMGVAQCSLGLEDRIGGAAPWTTSPASAA
jgi:hypothetical protein